MCTTTSGMLTLAGMLSDPLIQAMMHSDGVSYVDHASLLFRLKSTLDDRVTAFNHLVPAAREMATR